MIVSFIHSFQSEWLKKKRSAASWLVITGSFFIPLIILIALLTDPESTYGIAKSDKYWERLFGQNSAPMAMFLLPMGVILATSLVTQLEFKNNTWKQLHTTPQSLATIFLTKLGVIISMMIQFFVLFNICVYLSGILPSLFLKATQFPLEPYPFKYILKANAKLFIDCLPIIALQYLLGLKFKNFLGPVGIGLGLYIAAMISTNWQRGYLIPYSYCALNVQRGSVDPTVNAHYWAIGYFIIITAISYFLYLSKKEKG
jgi:hypothetical protein